MSAQIELWKTLSEERGFSVIPLIKMRPFEVDWTQWCRRKREFIASDFMGKNAGIACGSASGTIVLDIDDIARFAKLKEENNWELPKTLVVRTGSGKFHYYYGWVMNGHVYGCTSFKAPDNPDITVFDIRGNGGQVVAPGSIHPDTHRPYEIVRDAKIVQAPQWLLDLVSNPETQTIVSEYEPPPDGFKWDGTINGLPISREKKNVITEGTNKGERSEAILGVLNALCFAELTDNQIQDIFENYAIGEKYREKSKNRHKWLSKQIRKARAYVTSTISLLQRSSNSSFSFLNTNTTNYNYNTNNKIARDVPDVEVWKEVDIPEQNQQDANVSKCQRKSANVSNVSAKCQQKNDENDKCAETQENQVADICTVKEQLSASGVNPDFVQDVAEILTKTCERELENTHLEKVCRHLADILLTSADTCRHLLTSGNLTQDIRHWVMISDGTFHITDIYRDLNITSRNIKLSVQKALERVAKEGLIEKYGTKKGTYRVINSQCDQIDWMADNSLSLPIYYPFGIENLVDTLPGNIVCVAGEPNAGKTAFLLNIVEKNMSRFDIHYFSSEMGAAEFKRRLLGFEPDRSINEWKFNAWERYSNFADVIKPGNGNLNIIDFLEVNEDFWRVGGMMKEIHDKLNGAIAIVALQKNIGANVGLGGARGLEKPRLYLTMGPGWCKIVKGKNWKSKENPNNLLINYKLINGCKFITDGPWKLHVEETGGKYK